jgi:predicted PolB exonuclease-like 3'-5' exonuclease
MLDTIKISSILFLDVETVPLVYNYRDLPEETKRLWDTKFRYPTAEKPEESYKKAGIYAEFSKVVCISVGFFNNGAFRIKSFYRSNEKALLEEFAALLNKYFNKKESLLCAHNGKEFDFPFLCRRMLINGIKLPKTLNLAGKKPWEVQHLDTMELWKFGDYKNYTSLNLLASVFNIPTPKDDIDGSQVAKVFYEEKNIKRIVTYCQKDVLTVAQILLRYRGEPLFEKKNIVYI